MNQSGESGTTKQKTNRLRKLVLDELSFVPKGANKLSKVTIYKAMEPTVEDHITVVDTIDATLDVFAEQLASEKKITKAQAMVEVLETADGRELYSDRCAAMSDPIVVAKRAAAIATRSDVAKNVTTPIAKAEQAIDDYTKSIQKQGESDAAAMTRALSQRPELYRAYLASQPRSLE